jgi:hypothetical protein
MIFTQNFNILSDNPIAPNSVRAAYSDCEFALPMLAELGTKTDDLKNDYFNFIAFFPEQVTAATTWLQTESGEVVIGSYGVVSPLGYFTNSKNEKPVSILIDWHAVLNDLGVGCYRLIIRGALGATTIEHRSFKFALQAYNTINADETVRIEWMISGEVGDNSNPRYYRDFSTQEFINCIRLPNALFGGDTSSAEQVNVRYSNGQKVYTEQNRKAKYTLTTGRYPYAIHQFLQYDALMGENTNITDYNLQNPTFHLQTPVCNFGDYEPSWVVGSEFASLSVECESEFDNHYKFR